MALALDRYLDPVEPEEQVPEYVYYDIDLEGVAWNYRLFWNDRSERWQMDVWTSEVDADGNPVKAIYGKKLVPNHPMFWAHTGRRPEGGYIYLLDTGDPDAGDQCTFDGLGWRWKLCWLSDDGAPYPSTANYTITVP